MILRVDLKQGELLKRGALSRRDDCDTPKSVILMRVRDQINEGEPMGHNMEAFKRVFIHVTVIETKLYCILLIHGDPANRTYDLE